MLCEKSFSCLWRKCILSYFLIVSFYLFDAHSFLYDQRMKEMMAFSFHQETSDQSFNGTWVNKIVFIRLCFTNDWQINSRNMDNHDLTVLQSTAASSGLTALLAEPVLTWVWFNQVVPILQTALSPSLKLENIAKHFSALHLGWKAIIPPSQKGLQV